MTYLFTSESVSEGHPDKICDQISDAILDSALQQDPNSRVAAECFASTGLVLIGGEVTTAAQLDFRAIVTEVLHQIGYTDAEYGIEADNCAVLTAINKQSSDIAQGVNKGEGLFKELGAGDQGMMFGYACKQTDVYMPLPIYLAHQLILELARLRKTNAIPYLRPDAKAQVTVEYDGNRPLRVDTVVVSTQHHPDVPRPQLVKDIEEKLIRRVIPARYLDNTTTFLINPTGRFVIGGPKGDAGLTGRKIIVDTYGGWARHGGGAFSGKDCTKVDRSGAYMARYVAKNIVAAGLAEEAEIQLAYAIGVANPVSVRIDTKGSSSLEETRLVKLVRDHFDLTPEGIITSLDLQKPVFRATAVGGHFGRDDLDLSWEKTDKAEALRQAASKIATVS